MYIQALPVSATAVAAATAMESAATAAMEAATAAAVESTTAGITHRGHRHRLLMAAGVSAVVSATTKGPRSNCPLWPPVSAAISTTGIRRGIRHDRRDSHTRRDIRSHRGIHTSRDSRIRPVHAAIPTTGTSADEEATVKPAGAIVAVGRASIRIIRVIAPLAYGRTIIRPELQPLPARCPLPLRPGREQRLLQMAAPGSSRTAINFKLFISSSYVLPGRAFRARDHRFQHMPVCVSLFPGYCTFEQLMRE